MKVSSEMSHKVTALSFVAMVCVVMIHSHAIGTYENPKPWCVFVQALLMRTATDWAVPFFFVVSGFFFAALNLEKLSISWYGKLLRKKLRTLLVPYVLWALIGTVFSMSLVVANNLIMHHGLFERTFMAADGFWGKIDSLLGVTRGGPSGNLALWYVRSLLLLFVLSPLLAGVSKIHKTALLVIGLLLALAVPEVSIKFLSLKLGSVGWFCVGMGASQLAIENRRMPNALFVLAGLGWGALVVLGAMDKAGCLVASNVVTPYMMPFAALAGIMFWWGLYDRLLCLRCGDLPECFKMTFWVYCLHGVVTAWILAPVGYLLGKSDWVAMLASFLSVCGSIGFCLVVGQLVKHRFPKFYALLSGGR